ncbi:MAG: cytochrome c-type biogenesis protein CcmH [Anaerolineae bacterium]
MSRVYKALRPFILLVMAFSISRTIYAQDGGTVTVTDDQVNAIAHTLYCPVCENITLDVCGTAACADWRAEIRIQLEQGMSAEQITEDFVRRFGDRVVGTPLDPTLRNLSLITPYILIAGVLVAAASVLARRKRGADPVTAAANANIETNRYQDLFEQDINNS